MPMAARNRGTTLPPRFFGPVLLDRGPCSGLTIRMLKLNRPRKPILQEIIRRNVSDQLRIRGDLGYSCHIKCEPRSATDSPRPRPDDLSLAPGYCRAGLAGGARFPRVSLGGETSLRRNAR